MNGLVVGVYALVMRWREEERRGGSGGGGEEGSK